MNSRPASHPQTGNLAAGISFGGSLVTYGKLLRWTDWATKWYLLVALVAALAVGFAAWAASPRTKLAVAVWLVGAALVGLVAAPLVGAIIVYEITGGTD
jgi:hypothetical protein